MTAGIYKLTFAPGVDLIGGAPDIQAEFDYWEKAFLRNDVAENLQAAYKKYGMPDTKILLECHKDHVSFLRDYYIQLKKPSLSFTRKEERLSEEEINIVARGLYLFQHSTIRLVELIEKYEEALADAEQSIDAVLAENKECKEVCAKEIDVIKALKVATDQYTLSMIEKEEEIEDLKAELKRAKLPLRRKLFG